MLGKELRPGHLTTFGLVLKVAHEGDVPDGIYDGPHILWMEVNDPYYGAVSSTLQLEDEYDILYEEGTPQYREAVKKMIDQRAECIEYAQRDIRDLLQYVK